MLMASSVPPSSESAASLRNMPYMEQKWHASRLVASPRATLASASSPSLSPLHAIAPSADPSYGHDPNVMNTPLISPPSPSRLLPQLAGLPADTRQLHPPPTSTLYSHQFPLQPNHRRQDVVPFSLSASSSSDHPDNYISHGSTRPINLSYSTENVSINPYHRPRTSHPVFHSPSALAAHHGIPQSLPPVPRTSKFAPAPSSVPLSTPAPPVTSSSSSDFDFSSLCSNYLNMLSQKTEENQHVPEQMTVGPDMSPDADAVQAIMEAIQASPEFRMAQDFNEFLTSPMDDSPFEDFLTTPAIGSVDMANDILTSPAIFDDDRFGLDDAPLFGGDALGLSGALEPAKPTSTARHDQSLAHHALDLNNLYTMPSPNTPSLDPTSLHPSPRTTSDPAPSTPGRRPRKNLPTGTRKNISPETLVDVDAPIQPRKYVTPSATSRKEVPTAWLKKRSRSQALGEEDELEDEAIIGLGDMEAIEAKRRQNTLAARRSRKRKLEYQRELETSFEREREEKEMWRQRAMLYKALLEGHGHEVPSFDSA